MAEVLMGILFVEMMRIKRRKKILIVMMNYFVISGCVFSQIQLVWMKKDSVSLRL